MERIRLKMFAQILEIYQHLSLLLSSNPGEAIQHFFFFNNTYPSTGKGK